MWPACGSWAVCGSCAVCASRAMWGLKGPCVAGKVGVWPVGHVWLAWPMCDCEGPCLAGGHLWLFGTCVASQPSVAGELGVAGRPYCISGPTAADRLCVARGLWAVADVSCVVGRPCLSDAPWLCDSPFLASGLCRGAGACVAGVLERLGGRVWLVRLRAGRLGTRGLGRWARCGWRARCGRLATSARQVACGRRREWVYAMQDLTSPPPPKRTL